jgi:hypothetical protein
MSKIILNQEYAPADITATGNDKVVFPNSNDAGRLWYKDASGVYPLDGNDEARFRVAAFAIDASNFAGATTAAEKTYSFSAVGYPVNFALDITTVFTGNNDVNDTWRVIELFRDSTNEAIAPPVSALTTGVYVFPAYILGAGFTDIRVRIRSNVAQDGLGGAAHLKLGYFSA